jgi:hypothetical protein
MYTTIRWNHFNIMYIILIVLQLVNKKHIFKDLFIIDLSNFSGDLKLKIC